MLNKSAAVARRLAAWVPARVKARVSGGRRSAGRRRCRTGGGGGRRTRPRRGRHDFAVEVFWPLQPRARLSLGLGDLVLPARALDLNEGGSRADLDQVLAQRPADPRRLPSDHREPALRLEEPVRRGQPRRRLFDFGDCGPVQSPKSRRQPENGGAGYASEVSRCNLHIIKLSRNG